MVTLLLWRKTWLCRNCFRVFAGELFKTAHHALLLKSTLFSLLSSSYAAPKTGKHGNSILRAFTHRAPRIDLSVILSRDFEKQRRASFKTQKPRTKRHRDLSFIVDFNFVSCFVSLDSRREREQEIKRPSLSAQTREGIKRIRALSSLRFTYFTYLWIYHTCPTSSTNENKTNALH